MEESLKIDRMSFAKKRQRDMESFSPDRDYPQLARKQAKRISSLEEENRRLREALDAFWAGSLVIESSVRRTEGKGSPVYQNVLSAILKAQEFYKKLPKAARAALSQEEKP